MKVNGWHLWNRYIIFLFKIPKYAHELLDSKESCSPFSYQFLTRFLAKKATFSFRIQQTRSQASHQWHIASQCIRKSAIKNAGPRRIAFVHHINCSICFHCYQPKHKTWLAYSKIDPTCIWKKIVLQICKTLTSSSGRGRKVRCLRPIHTHHSKPGR